MPSSLHSARPFPEAKEPALNSFSVAVAPKTALCLLCCHIYLHEKILQTNLESCIASLFTCHHIKEPGNISILNPYFRFYKSCLLLITSG